MPGYVIGLILLAAVAALFILLLWNALELTSSEEQRPALRRRVLVALFGAPGVLLAIGFVVLAQHR